ncbi:hypothetical protein ACFLTM_05895 [Candidatus Bipolaricaulota bacterium]
MKRSVLAVCAIVLVGILVGCGGEGGNNEPSIALNTVFEVTQNARMVQIGEDMSGNAEYQMKDYHEIAGVVENPSDAKAYAVQVVITVSSPDGDTLHEETIELGNVEAGAEKPFKYRWYTEDEVTLDARAVAGEPPDDDG